MVSNDAENSKPQIEHVVALVESDPSLTLHQLSDRVEHELEIHVSKSNIGNYLEGKTLRR